MDHMLRARAPTDVECRPDFAGGVVRAAPSNESLVLDVLRSVDFLAGEPRETIVEFRAIGRSLAAPRGHTFWCAGHAEQSVVIPLDGEISLMRSNSDGRDVCHALVGPGECAGLECIIGEHSQVADARAIRDGAYFTADGAAVVRFLDRHPAARARALAAVGRLYRTVVDEREGLVFLPVSARLARFLLSSACLRRSDGARVLVRATHSEIAARLGTVREVVARVIADFTQRGLIRHTPAERFILNWDGLVAESGADGVIPPRATGSDEAAATRRFTLPILHQGAPTTAAEAAACGGHVGDLTQCAERGCPLAIAAWTGPAASLRTSAEPRRPAATCALPAQVIACAPPRPRALPRAPVQSPPAPSAPVSIPSLLRARRAKAGEIPRDPYEERVIAMRVLTYTTRAASIETQFGPGDRVPAYVSLFSDRAAARALVCVTGTCVTGT